MRIVLFVFGAFCLYATCVAFDAALKETAPGVASAEMMMAFLFGGLGFLYVVFGVMYKKMHLT